MTPLKIAINTLWLELRIHKIRIQLRLHPTPCWGSAAPRLPSWIWGGEREWEMGKKNRGREGRPSMSGK